MTRALIVLVSTLATPIALSGCDCSDVGYVDQTTLYLQDSPRPGERWQIEISVDGEPRCTLVPTDAVDAYGLECSPSAPAYWTPGPERSELVVNGLAPATLEVRVTIDDAVVADSAHSPRYDDEYPEGRMCGSRRSVGAVRVPIARPGG